VTRNQNGVRGAKKNRTKQASLLSGESLAQKIAFSASKKQLKLVNQ